MLTQGHTDRRGCLYLRQDYAVMFSLSKSEMSPIVLSGEYLMAKVIIHMSHKKRAPPEHVGIGQPS
ncbi:hypothetical protein SRDD_04230 [Serratia sp. DD3]|nr:hypothetical protein SRDD_04230 [Serratia sp. DD3]